MHITKKLFLCSAIFIFCSSFAQIHLPVLNNDVNNILVKIIEDFPDHFNKIRGDVIDKDVQTITYASLVNIPGKDSGIIIQNGDVKDNIYSWKQVVFASDNFDAAKAKFHEYYKKINGTKVIVDNNKIVFNADYNEPDDTKQFTTVLFITHPQTKQLKNVIIDLSLHYLIDNWQVSISVYDHKDYGVDDN